MTQFPKNSPSSHGLVVGYVAPLAYVCIDKASEGFLPRLFPEFDLAPLPQSTMLRKVLFDTHFEETEHLCIE